jgi:hypothetical protein
MADADAERISLLAWGFRRSMAHTRHEVVALT